MVDLDTASAAAEIASHQGEAMEEPVPLQRKSSNNVNSNSDLGSECDGKNNLDETFDPSKGLKVRCRRSLVFEPSPSFLASI